jgi:hypothetical protein
MPAPKECGYRATKSDTWEIVVKEGIMSKDDIFTYAGGKLAGCIIFAAVLLAANGASAQTPPTNSGGAELRARIEFLERELQALKKTVEGTQKETLETKQELRAVKKEVKKEASTTKKELRAVKREAGGQDRSLTKWHLAGYASTDLTPTNTRSGESTFTGAQFNPVFHFQYDDLLLFEGELEFEVEGDGETKAELEYTQLDLLLSDYAILVVGKYLSPIGKFQEQIHPTWINKLPDRPVGFGKGGAQPLSDVGVQLRGAVPLGSMEANYVVFAGNGPRVTHEGFELEGFASDNNSDKAVGGRIGFLPLPYLEVGGSFMSAEVRGEEATMGPVTDADFTLWGADAAFTKGAFDIRGEYLHSKLGGFLGAAIEDAEITSYIPETEWEAWYVQAAYQLSGLTDIPVLRKLEPVVRYGMFDVDGFAPFTANEEKRLTVGVNYLLAPSAIAKAAYEMREFDRSKGSDEDVARLQLTYGF